MGMSHKAKHLQIPDNIILLFQPPHCPELNPIAHSMGTSQTLAILAAL